MTPWRGFVRTGASALALALCVSPAAFAQKETKDGKDDKDDKPVLAPPFASLLSLQSLPSFFLEAFPERSELFPDLRERVPDSSTRLPSRARPPPQPA